MSIDIVIAVATGILLLAGLLGGYRRGPIREAITLSSILLGALLLEYWGDRWTLWLTQRGFEGATARLITELALLGAPVVGSYGAGLLLRGPLSRAERIFGAGLGLLNFALLGALAVRAWQRFGWGEADPAQPVGSWLRDAIVTRYVLDYYALALLALAGALVLVALGAAIARIVRFASRPRPPKPQRSAQRPAANGKPPAGSVPPQPQAQPQPQQPHTPPGQQEKFLD